MTDRELLTKAIVVSGLSARKLATRLLARDERTVRRWESGDTPIPKVVRKRLERFVRLSAAERDSLIRLL